MAERTPVRAAKKSIELPAGIASRLDAIRMHVEKTVAGAKMMRFDGVIAPIPVIPTGSLQLDRAVGVGGYPCGRIVEIFGPESSGKTTLTLHAIAAAQRAGGVAAFIDAEHALDPKYARALGVDFKQLLISQPDCGEQSMQIVDHLLDTGYFKQGDLIVVDSVAALTPKAEIDGEVGDQNIGLHARLMSQSLRMLAGKVFQSGAVLYFTNQLRDKIQTGGFGPNKTTTGGNALKFYASLRLDIRRTGSVKDGDSVSVANNVEIKVVKNKVAPPFTQATTLIRFGEGVSRFDELIDLGLEFGMVVQSGSWFSQGDERLGQGRENVIALLRANPDKANSLEFEIRKALSA